MAQIFRSILSAIAASIITAIFAWITIKAQIINDKADIDYVNKIEEEYKLEDNRLLETIKEGQETDKEEREKIEKRRSQEILYVRQLLQEIKSDVKDIKKNQ